MFGLSKEEKEIKRIEQMRKANNQLNQLQESINKLDCSISKAREQCREYLLENDQGGFEVYANQIFYYQDLRKMISTVKAHYGAFLMTAETSESLEGLRPCLKDCSKLMASFPSFAKNSKDFAKFQRSLTRGQLNMKAMGDMLKDLDPATKQTRSKEDFDALRESLLVGTDKAMTPNINANTKTNANSNVDIDPNKDFFDALKI